MNILQYRGTEIKVEFTEETHYFELTENGVVTRIIVNSPSVSDAVKQITLNSTIQKLDNLGNVNVNFTCFFTFCFGLNSFFGFVR